VLEWPADASATELPPLPPTHEAFLRQLRNQGHAVWLTTSSEVARWWVERERFQLKVRTAGARVEFDISILGDKPFSGAALVVVLPGAQQKPRVQGLKSGMPEPEIQLMDEFRAVMRFPVLKPGNYTYLATF
jgi:hypothetical protein